MPPQHRQMRVGEWVDEKYGDRVRGRQQCWIRHRGFPLHRRYRPAAVRRRIGRCRDLRGASAVTTFSRATGICWKYVEGFRAGPAGRFRDMPRTVTGWRRYGLNRCQRVYPAGYTARLGTVFCPDRAVVELLLLGGGYVYDSDTLRYFNVRAATQEGLPWPPRSRR